MDCDVVVIGAGLAGLRCAQRLRAAGRLVQVLEASDQVGGRVRTDQVEGFLLDRGFQVLNPAYPAVRRWIDLPALRMQGFATGVRVRTDVGHAVLADPRRAPGLLGATLRGGLLDARDLIALTRWLAPVLSHPESVTSDGGPDTALSAALDQIGARGRLRRVLDRFVAGTIADTHGHTSANFVRLLLRSFLIGTPGLPERGMRALPEQLARGIDVRLGHVVERIDRSAVHGGFGTVDARHVVVATDPRTAAGLLGRRMPTMKGLTTWWWSAPGVEQDHPLLAVDGRDGPDGGPPGPVWNTAVISRSAPSYAPPGQHLIQATAVGDRPAATDRDAQAHAADILGVAPEGWQLLRRDDLPHALPESLPPLRARAEQQISDGLWLAGDHVDTGSIQGALASGDRCARALLAHDHGAPIDHDAPTTS